MALFSNLQGGVPAGLFQQGGGDLQVLGVGGVADPDQADLLSAASSAGGDGRSNTVLAGRHNQRQPAPQHPAFAAGPQVDKHGGKVGLFDQAAGGQVGQA